MPPRLMTATSVVPPPMSTMRLPLGSLMGRPAPMAAAMGSSMRRAQRAPALRAASRTARRSTSVTPDGMPSSMRGRGTSPTRSCTRWTKYLIICSVTSKSLMTPSRSGRIGVMLAGVRPTMRLASAPISSTLRVRRVDGHDAGLADDDAPATHVDEGVGRTQVHPDVTGEARRRMRRSSSDERPPWVAGQGHGVRERRQARSLTAGDGLDAPERATAGFRPPSSTTVRCPEYTRGHRSPRTLCSAIALGPSDTQASSPIRTIPGTELSGCIVAGGSSAAGDVFLGMAFACQRHIPCEGPDVPVPGWEGSDGYRAGGPGATW